MEWKCYNFKLCSIIFISFIVFEKFTLSEIPRPRGVPLSRASLYDPQKDFVCFDGSLTIPFTQVNDEYCDCPDASDEPGTAACPSGAFHCTNAGHKPLNLPSSRVNDGICDCCDGSDEYSNKHIKCIDNCLELGRSAREEAQKKAQLIKAGKQLRAELSQKGTQLKQEQKEKLVQLQRNKVEAEKVRSEKEALKKEAEELESVALQEYRKIEEEEKRKKREEEEAKERAEAVETFEKFDSNRDGKIELTELQTRQSFDKDRNGEVSDDEAKYFLNGETAVDQEKFVTECWSNIKPYLMMDSGLFKPPVTQDGEEGEGEEQEEQLEGTEGEEDEEGEDHEEEQEEEHVEEPAPGLTYDEETQKLVDEAASARDEYAKAERAVKDIQNEIKDIEEYLELDFGSDEEFATLRGQCFEYTDHEYIYKLCPFDKTLQQPKSSSLETRLGVWADWAGPEENKYEVMLFEKGQSCWNGPQRSTRVQVSCGSENKVTSVSEPNRCEYSFDFITPAACREIGLDSNDDVHDEL